MNKINFLLIISGTIYTFSSDTTLASQFSDRISDTQITTTANMEQSNLMIAGILPKDGEDMYEIEFWNSIKDSTHAEDYDAYLKSYPNGRFAPLAKVRAERYRKDDVSPVQIEEMNERYNVITNTNIRKEPSSSTEKIGELKEGESVEVTGRVTDKNWFRINLPSGGDGYVYAPLLAKPAPTESKRVQATPPPPQPVSRPPASTIQATPTPAPTAPVSVGSTGKDCPECPEMVVISPGEFIMGDDKGDRSEKPAHKVRISQPFAIGKYEVTVAQWKACVKAGACKKVSDKIMSSDNVPVRDVSWGDATDYVAWLSKITGKAYRLPTESEWEYANRAGSRTTYWWGDQMVPGKAYCKDCGSAWDQKLPAEVGSFEPNPFGLYDMNGNVWEWVDDC